MTKASWRIKYPSVTAEISSDTKLRARSYIVMLVSTLGDVADEIEAFSPGHESAISRNISGNIESQKKTLCNLVVESANSLSAAFNSAITGLRRSEIWDLPTKELAKFYERMDTELCGPLGKSRKVKQPTTGVTIEQYTTTIESITAEILAEIQSWGSSKTSMSLPPNDSLLLIIAYRFHAEFT